jgi:malate dehydrogenase (oxaloacetate-decarboxylating)
VLAFPGVFRGMLDAAAEEFTEEMALAAARAIADVVGEDKLNPTVIIPSVFDPKVTPAVAAAIRAVVRGGHAPHNAAAVPEVELDEAPEESF